MMRMTHHTESMIIIGTTARPGAAADGGDGMREGQQAVEERYRARLLHTEGDNAGCAVEKCDELTRPEVVTKADQLSHNDGDENAEARAAHGAVVLPGAEVLPHERGAGHRKKLVMGRKAKPSILQCAP